MNPGKAPVAWDADEKIAALIETLHRTEQQLDLLTSGELDSVADRGGRTWLLRRAQDALRHSDAARQAAILDALPAHIALLDPQGRIVSVNASWKRFGDANALQAPGHAVGLNYLAICDNARGDFSTEAHQVAAGVRSVLAGDAKSFSIEYPCDSPTEQRWFLLTATPLAADHPNGVVVMHMNITARKHEEERTAALLQLFVAPPESDEKALLQRGLDVIQRLTGSRVGFLHFVNDNQDELELVTWSTDTLAGYCRAAFERHYPVSAAGIWADSVRKRKPVIVNDYAAAPDKRGLPEGHASLQRFISVPVVEEGLVRMIVGVGNAARNYAQDDVETVTLFSYDLYRIAQRKRAQDQIKAHLEELGRTFVSTVEVISIIGDMRDPYTTGHERRVAEIASAIGAELGLDARQREGLRIAGHLHDVGKISIPSEILSKPGRISPLEYQFIQTHAQAGYDVLKSLNWPWPVALVALQHHERIDGSGYPQGLKGAAILPEARIVAVADVVEAMSSHRPYRAALGLEKALAEIERGRATAYDADAADACLKLFREKGYAISA